jgi:hypothetical protein
MTRTIRFSLALVAIAISFTLALGASAQANRDPIVEMVRAWARNEAKQTGDHAARYMSEASKNAIRWRVVQFGSARPCGRYDKKDRAKIRCGAWFRMEGTDVRGKKRGIMATTKYYVRVTNDGRQLRLRLLAEPRWSNSTYDPNQDRSLAYRTRAAMVWRRPRLTESAIYLRSRKLAGDYCEQYAEHNNWFPNPPTQRVNFCWHFDADYCKVYFFGRRGRCNIDFAIRRESVTPPHFLYCEGRAYWRIKIDGKMAVIDLRKDPSKSLICHTGRT